MWCFVNHTKRHIVSGDMYDIGRRLKSLISSANWSLIDDIDIEDIDVKTSYQGYTFDV